MKSNHNMPSTVDDAVNYLLTYLPLNNEIQVTMMKKEDLDELHFSLGAYARNALGLWSGNEALLESCRLISGNKEIDADDASMLIIGLLWEKLHSEDNTRLASDRET